MTVRSVTLVVGEGMDSQISQLLVVGPVYGLRYFGLGDWDHLAVVRFADSVVDKLLPSRWDARDLEIAVEA